MKLSDSHLLVVSHKLCWPSSTSVSGFATDGGFPIQINALSELFKTTTLVVPCAADAPRAGEVPLRGHGLTVEPLTVPRGRGLARKLDMLPWLAQNAGTLWRQTGRADAVHAPIPGDVGTIGMLIGLARSKPLFVRHCGNWLEPRTAAERFWKWFMQRAAGGRNVMFATGGSVQRPSVTNPSLEWIFSTTLTASELSACAAERDLPSDRCRLIIACRQDSEKGAGIVVDALPLVLQRFPNASLDVVGAGRALPALTQRTAGSSVSDRVRFHGKVDHLTVIRLMRESDLFCYPTTASEGFPKVVLEALACGLPVITTRVSALPKLLASGCGVLLDESTPAAVAAAVETCLGSRERYRAMSGAAVQTAREYSLERWRDTIGGRLTAAWADHA